MDLCQAYYIEKRNNDDHIDLNGKWDFCWRDTACDSVDSLTFDYQCTLPSSVYHSLSASGVLPHPYYGTNSKYYGWVDEKVWYYRKRFNLDRSSFDGNAYLCFDGVAYYCRLWVNGTLLGEHEGMFGGPCTDVHSLLNLCGENEIIAEVRSCNFGKKDGYDFWNRNGENREIIPWNIIRDTSTSNGDFIVLGIWNDVRLELLNKIHISRPYMYTESIGKDSAEIRFEVEIADGTIAELRKFFGIRDHLYDYTRAFDSGLTGAVRDRSVELEIEFSDNGKRVYYTKNSIPLTDFNGLGMDARYHEMQFYRTDITLNEPKLWYPNGMGDPFLYDVTVKLFADGVLMDTQAFKYGVRTFTASYTRGNKYRNRWDKFLFSVNGKEIFLKGMNWMPIDYLYDISPDRYEWCLALVKNAGIQLLRVWNGGGYPETDLFYQLCDKYGIMVWQDEYIANTDSSVSFPHDVLECQCAYNLYRTRNHPSLVILCGGNEFNPYTEGNGASMFVIQRTVDMLAPDRVFYYTTADKGSAHIYIDMEPVWYRHRYKQLPFLAESGIHSFPCHRTLKKFVGEKEIQKKPVDLTAPDFATQFPSFFNHVTEFLPERVPRMMARNSQIIDISACSLGELCEASQVQVYEFYQLMIQAMRENFPYCGGVMPWGFKRPWPTVGCQTVDGDDNAGLCYYAVLNSYSPVNVCWCQQWSVLAPKESLSLVVKTFNQNDTDLSDAELCLTVFRPDMTVFKEYTTSFKPVCDFGILQIDDSFTNTCFLVCADVKLDGDIISRSVYFNKCTDALSDKELYDKYRLAPTENLYFKNGPYLKPTIESAKKAKLSASIVSTGINGKYHFADIALKNISDITAYPITAETVNEDQRFFLSENFFMIKPNEEKTLRITCDSGKVSDVKISFWNGDTLYLTAL